MKSAGGVSGLRSARVGMAAEQPRGVGTFGTTAVSMESRLVASNTKTGPLAGQVMKQIRCSMFDPFKALTKCKAYLRGAMGLGRGGSVHLGWWSRYWRWRDRMPAGSAMQQEHLDVVQLFLRDAGIMELLAM